MPKTRSSYQTSEDETHVVPSQMIPKPKKTRKTKRVKKPSVSDVEENSLSVWADEIYEESESDTRNKKAKLDLTVWTEEDKDVHVWLKKDVRQLMEKIHEATSEVHEESCFKIDSLIDWESVKFGRFTAGECMRMWNRIRKKVRKSRSVEEYWSAANEMVYNDVTAFLKFQKPMTAEQLYIEKKLNNILEGNSDMDEETAKEGLKRKYKELSEDRREKYIEKAKKMKKIVSAEKGKVVPPKPPLPVDFFLDLKLSSLMDKHPDLSKGAARNECRNKYKALSDEKKLKYINKAINAVPEFMEEVETQWLDKNGRGVNFLSKDEIRIKKTDEGIPTSPPSKAYALFTSQILQSEGFINGEGFKEVSKVWKTVRDDEKERLRQEAKERQKEYNQKMRDVLLSMDEDKRNVLTLVLKLPTLQSLNPAKSKAKNKKMTDYFQNSKARREKKPQESNEDSQNGTQETVTQSNSTD